MPTPCIHCGDKNAHRVPRQWYEKLIAIKAFYCYRCKKRFLIYRIGAQQTGKAA